MWKSETSGIEIPDVIMADDGSVCTEMSDIQSPLSVARKKMTAHMINERIAMLKSGMSPQEIVAHYEKLEGGGGGGGGSNGTKKKSKSKKSKNSNSKPAIPEAIPEVPDLFLGTSVAGLPPPPPPPPLFSANEVGDSQSFQELKQQRPSHFQAFLQAEQQPLRRGGQFNTVQDAPRPSHFAAFEEASHSSGKKNNNRKTNVIQTKSLQRMRTPGGDAAPPHYLALEMESKNAKNKKGSTMRRRSSMKRNTNGEFEALPNRNERNALDDKLNSLKNHFDYEKTNADADLSAELSAFWAKQRKTQKSQSMRKMELEAEAANKLTRARATDGVIPLSGGDYSSSSSHRRMVSSDGSGSTFLRGGNNRTPDRSPHSSGDRMDYMSSTSSRRPDRSPHSSGDRMDYVSSSTSSHRRSSSNDDMTKSEKRELNRKMEKLLSAEHTRRKDRRGSGDGSEKKERKSERRASGEHKKRDSTARRMERRSSGDHKKKSGYQVQMRLSASRSPPPPENRSRLKSTTTTPPITSRAGSTSEQQYNVIAAAAAALPPPPIETNIFAATTAPAVLLEMANGSISDEFDDSFVQNDDFENGSFKTMSTMGTRQTAATSSSRAGDGSAKAYRLRGTDLLDLAEDGDDGSQNNGAFGQVKRNASFRMVKQSG